MTANETKMLETIGAALGIDPDVVVWTAPVLAQRTGRSASQQGRDLMAVVLAVEEAFDLTIADDDLEHLKTPRDLLEYVEAFHG